MEPIRMQDDEKLDMAYKLWTRLTKAYEEHLYAREDILDKKEHKAQVEDFRMIYTFLLNAVIDGFMTYDDTNLYEVQDYLKKRDRKKKKIKRASEE